MVLSSIDWRSFGDPYINNFVFSEWDGKLLHQIHCKLQQDMQQGRRSFYCVRAICKLGLTWLHGSSAGLLRRLGCNIMVSSVQQIATRAFVSVLVVLARSYDVALAVSRDSSAEDLLKAYRRLLQKVSSCVRGFL